MDWIFVRLVPQSLVLSPYITALVTSDWKSSVEISSLLLMAEILHQLIGSLSHYLQGFYTSQVVQDFSHQQYHECCGRSWWVVGHRFTCWSKLANNASTFGRALRRSLEVPVDWFLHCCLRHKIWNHYLQLQKWQFWNGRCRNRREGQNIEVLSIYNSNISLTSLTMIVAMLISSLLSLSPPKWECDVLVNDARRAIAFLEARHS